MSSLPNFSRQGYQVKRQLGHNHAGGRSTYLAINARTRQPVVIKQFEFTKPNSNWSAYEAYNREIAVLQGLNHPGIPRYLDCFETPSGLCLVQEYKHAKSLAKLRSFSAAEIKKIAVDLLEILVYLQNRIPCVIHRDIKPENILVDDKINVYLVDFGFAKIGEGELSLSSMVKGSVGFMPPEQLLNRHLTEASDLYSIGVTLVCLLTGTRSSAIANLMDDNYHLNFRHLLPKVSLRWLDWLEKMVQIKPKHRFKDATTALEALKPIYVLRTPEVKFSASTLEFNASKLGAKVTQTLMVNNPIPDTLLQGNWEFSPHPSDPNFTPYSHSWISIQPQQFASNRFNCKITVDTSHLRAGTTYFRKILFRSNSLPDTQTLNLKICTAPIPLHSKKLPYFSTTALLGLTAIGTWLEIGAWLETMVKFGSIGLFVAVFVTFLMAAIGAATAFIAKELIGFFAAFMPKYKRWTQVGVVLFVALMALFVTDVGSAFRGASSSFVIVDALVFFSGFLAENVASKCLKKGFHYSFSTTVAVLTMALGMSLGISCIPAFLNPLVIAGIFGFGLPLAALMSYPPLQRARLIAKYRHGQQHLIRP